MVKHRLGWVVGVFLLLAALPACERSVAPPAADQPPGQVVEVVDAYGVYYVYLPTSRSTGADILVLVHGTPQVDQSAEASARATIGYWLDFSEAQGWILIAPAFNQENFSSRLGDHALGGYRGLFGREIGADAWVLRLVQAYQAPAGNAGQPFYLYGHSAGGQFLGRFLVAHPELVKRAVITAAATYPQLDSAVAWPYGLGELHTELAWDAETTQKIDIIPDRGKWLAATQVPLTVIVGLDDTAELPVYPGQKGRNRFTNARRWLADMAEFARQNGLESRFELMVIPGKGHTQVGLIPYSQQALAGK
jgi:pimeloyl-ACP methyl ester carboxylesterase